MPTDFAKKLKELRKAKKLTQAALAVKLNVVPRQVQRYENNTIPKTETIKILNKEFKYDFFKLLNDDQISPHETEEKPIIVDISDSEIVTMLIQIRADVDVLTERVIDLMASRPGERKKIWEEFFSDTKHGVKALTRTIARGGEQETDESSS